MRYFIGTYSLADSDGIDLWFDEIRETALGKDILDDAFKYASKVIEEKSSDDFGYIHCHVYAHFDCEKRFTWFGLKYPQAQPNFKVRKKANHKYSR